MASDAVSPLTSTAKRLSDVPFRRLARAGPWITLALVVGLAIRLYRLDQRSIWFDESSAWRTSQFGVGEMFERIAANNHPPLYYLCLKIWTILFGDTIWSLRGLSVALSGLLMLCVYLFMRALHFADKTDGRWPGIVAALLVAFSPLQVRLSWETRMYMLGAVLAVVSSWLLYLAWNRRHSVRLWIGYGAAALAFAYTHYYACFTIFAQFVFVALALAADPQVTARRLRSDARVRGIFASGLVFALGWLPWLPVFLSQRARIDTQWWTWRFGLNDMSTVANTLIFGQGGRGWSAMLAIGLFLFITLMLFISGRPRNLYLGLLTLCPVLGSAFYSCIFRNIFIDRYFVFCQVFLLCGIATLLHQVKDTVIRNLAAIAAVSFTLATYYNLWASLDISRRPGMRGAAELIVERSDPGEPVVVSSPLIYYPMLYYLRDGYACRLVRTSDLPHNEGGAFAVEEDFIDQEALPQLRSERVWVVTGGWSDRPVTIPPEWSLVRSDTFREVYGFQGSIIVHEYDNHGPRTRNP